MGNQPDQFKEEKPWNIAWGITQRLNMASIALDQILLEKNDFIRGHDILCRIFVISSPFLDETEKTNIKTKLENIRNQSMKIEENRKKTTRAFSIPFDFIDQFQSLEMELYTLLHKYDLYMPKVEYGDPWDKLKNTH